MQIDGKELLITPASFEIAMRLKKNIADALRSDGINLDIGGLDSENVLESDLSGETIGSLVENIMAVATAPAVVSSLFECCQTVVIGENRERVDRDFFEEVENRQYFYPIMTEVLKANLGPFFRKIGSMFSDLPGLLGKFRK